MVTQALCQSCGIPLQDEWRKGTEENKLKSKLYCKFCYENGHFIHPEINLKEMVKNTEIQM
ncbi:zinc ribbon domain-containing protein [Flavobacterium sp. WC2430]|uniref:zinc ribbon domain-containing protein n=1 Tax=Flavobacterium sp. WC2430 TaxID=3234137 RepID=UPI003466987D